MTLVFEGRTESSSGLTGRQVTDGTTEVLVHSFLDLEVKIHSVYEHLSSYTLIICTQTSLDSSWNAISGTRESSVSRARAAEARGPESGFPAAM